MLGSMGKASILSGYADVGLDNENNGPRTYFNVNSQELVESSVDLEGPKITADVAASSFGGSKSVCRKSANKLEEQLRDGSRIGVSTVLRNKWNGETCYDLHHAQPPRTQSWSMTEKTCQFSPTVSHSLRSSTAKWA